MLSLFQRFEDEHEDEVEEVKVETETKVGPETEGGRGGIKMKLLRCVFCH